MKKIAYKFFDRTEYVSNFSETYKKIDFKYDYPGKSKRLEIFLSLIKKYKPRKIIDAGTGPGMPLIKIKKLGFNIKGYDRSANMVRKAKENLKNNKLNTNLINIGDFENPKHIANNSVDCILGLGAFYYSKNIIKTLTEQRKKLKKKGRLIFSLRNRLFELSSCNEYTIKFFNNLYETNKFEKNIRSKFNDLFSSYIINKKKTTLKKGCAVHCDEYNVKTSNHNPLNIRSELLNKVGLKLNGIYFYHFHALPPIFENIIPSKFRKESWKIENPKDWRGFFIASCFVVDCIKE